MEFQILNTLNPDQEPCFARKGEFYGHALTTRFWGDLNINCHKFIFIFINKITGGFCW
jgi:hypothetical protein